MIYQFTGGVSAVVMFAVNGTQTTKSRPSAAL